MSRDERRSYRYFKLYRRRVIGAMLLITAIILTFIYLNYTLKSTYTVSEVETTPAAVFKEETVTPVAIAQDFPVAKSLGNFKITFYCSDPNCKICGGGGDTASGVPVEEGVVSVDPDVIPLGTTVIIDGEEYLAADTGPWVKGNHIDMFVDVSHEEALSRGKIEREVFVYETDSE